MEKKDQKQKDLNLLQIAQIQQANFSRNIMEIGGYETFTTFFADLTIAESFGESAVIDTFERVLRDWGKNYKYFTEFVLCLNHKIWQHYQKNEALGRLYDTLWRKADDYCLDTFKGEELEYYLQVTD